MTAPPARIPSLLQQPPLPARPTSHADMHYTSIRGCYPLESVTDVTEPPPTLLSEAVVHDVLQLGQLAHEVVVTPPDEVTAQVRPAVRVGHLGGPLEQMLPQVELLLIVKLKERLGQASSVRGRRLGGAPLGRHGPTGQMIGQRIQQEAAALGQRSPLLCRSTSGGAELVAHLAAVLGEIETARGGEEIIGIGHGRRSMAHVLRL